MLVPSEQTVLIWQRRRLVASWLIGLFFLVGYGWLCRYANPMMMDSFRVGFQ